MSDVDAVSVGHENTGIGLNSHVDLDTLPHFQVQPGGLRPILWGAVFDRVSVCVCVCLFVMSPFVLAFEITQYSPHNHINEGMTFKSLLILKG